MFLLACNQIFDLLSSTAALSCVLGVGLLGLFFLLMFPMGRRAQQTLLTWVRSLNRNDRGDRCEMKVENWKATGLLIKMYNHSKNPELISMGGLRRRKHGGGSLTFRGPYFSTKLHCERFIANVFIILLLYSFTILHRNLHYH